MSPAPASYSGRFAPSPTGPLHAGSLVAALASFLDARSAAGHWAIRIDDIDPPRAVTGAAEDIVATLHHHQLVEDSPVQLQSQRGPSYDRALEQLAVAGLTFRCRCTRSTLSATGECIADCHKREIPDNETTSVRIKVPRATESTFNDRVLGPQFLALGTVCRNFILRRRDGLYAYQLACAVDDGDDTITHVVRGADLLESTHRQRFVQQCLGLTPPEYGHVPVITDVNGIKLSKQTGAQPLDTNAVTDNLRRALAQLGQKSPRLGLAASEVVSEAIANWSLDSIPR